MWKKLLIALAIVLTVLFVAIRFGVPYYANYKLHAFLEQADTASYSHLQFDYYEGNIVLRDLYVIDTSGNLAKQPIKLRMDRIAIKGLSVWTLIKENTAQADSIVFGNGRIAMPYLQKDSTEVKEPKKRKNKFLKSILLNHIIIDSVAVNLGLDAQKADERFAATISFEAKNVAIPLVKDAPLGWQGSLILRNLFFKDTQGNLSKIPVECAIDRIAITGADARELKTKHIAQIDSVVVGKGSMALGLPAKDTAKTEENTEKSKLIESILLNYVFIDSVAVNLDLNPKKVNERIDATISFEAQNVAIPFTKNAPLAYQKMSFNITNVYVQPRKSIAYFLVKSLGYNSTTNALQIDEFAMRQRIKETRYAKHFGTDKPYVKLDVYKATITGIPHDLKQLADGFHVKKIAVLGAQAYLYKDRRYPHPKTPKKFPIEALSSIKLPVRIDTILVTDGQLFYNENWREDYIPGRLSLTDINVAITNVNSTGPTNAGNFTKIKGDIVLSNELELAVNWQFDLRKKGKAFTLDLGIGTTPLKAMNSFTENTMGLHFKSGNLQGGRMVVHGDKTSGTGTLDLYYKDLKLDLMDKQTHESGIVEWAAGGLANLVVRNNNLKDQKPHQGIVYAEPLPDRAIYGYIVRLFFSGFKDIALGSKNEEKAEARKNGTVEKTKKSRKK